MLVLKPPTPSRKARRWSRLIRPSWSEMAAGNGCSSRFRQDLLLWTIRASALEAYIFPRNLRLHLTHPRSATLLVWLACFSQDSIDSQGSAHWSTCPKHASVCVLWSWPAIILLKPPEAETQVSSKSFEGKQIWKIVFSLFCDSLFVHWKLIDIDELDEHRWCVLETVSISMDMVTWFTVGGIPWCRVSLCRVRPELWDAEKQRLAELPWLPKPE